MEMDFMKDDDEYQTALKQEFDQNEMFEPIHEDHIKQLKQTIQTLKERFDEKITLLHDLAVKRQKQMQ